MNAFAALRLSMIVMYSASFAMIVSEINTRSIYFFRRRTTSASTGVTSSTGRGASCRLVRR